jgi:hypothetical protein
MAGGPHAAITLCLFCAGKAVRTAEGLENDQYRCESCGRGFLIDWSRGQPTESHWPPTPEELALFQRYIAQRQAPPPKP